MTKRPTHLALAAHLSALVFGLVGILIMLPHPELWRNDPNAVKVFNFSIDHAGSIHILFGALTMFMFGVAAIGLARTATFFIIACSFSLTSELLGTGTGWPFGNYAYTNYLGWKVLDHVPFSIPLSWFYVGFACYLVSRQFVAGLGVTRQSLWTLAGAVWLLTVWDLVLDPAMAHDSLKIKFWVWSETGPYFGMPIKNFIGWSITGLLYMGVSRLLWRTELAPSSYKVGVPLTIYLANMVFAMALSASVDLWIPVLLAIVLGVAPALSILLSDGPRPGTRLRRLPSAPRLVWPASISRG